MSEARAILDRRYAMGEISEPEYLRMCDLLDRPAPPSPDATKAAPVMAGIPVVDSDKTWPVAAPRRSNLLVRLWNGDVSLPATYWIVGTIGSVFVVAGANVALTMTETKAGEVLVISLALLWSLFVAIIVWRSATKYSANKKGSAVLWARLAKIIVCLAVLRNVANVGDATSGASFYKQVDAEIVSLKPTLPKKLNEGVTFDAMSRDGGNLIYRYTISGPGTLTTEQASILDANTRGNACSLKIMRPFLINMATVSFDYYNSNSVLLTHIVVKNGDCPQPATK